MSRLGDDMTNMETSITDLQDELVVANKPSKNKFKPWWLFVAVIVVSVIGFGAYFGTTRFVKVDANTETLVRICEQRNEQLLKVNEKFKQLVDLFNVSLAHRNPGEPPPSAEILRLYEEFRKPIEYIDCNQ